MTSHNPMDDRVAAIIEPGFLFSGSVAADPVPPVPDEIAGIYRIERPARPDSPLVIASPHSGRDYPSDLIEATRLGPLDLRSSEDAFMEEVLEGAADAGAPLLSALFPRVYVDVNREPYELDPDMYSDPLPPGAVTDSIRISAGLGTIARVVANSEPVYGRKLTVAEAEDRIRRCYAPYHRALQRLIAEAMERFGFCLLIDGHSMPSSAVRHMRSERRPVDIVLGDSHGVTAAPRFIERAENFFRARHYTVRRNSPYAGGFVTRHYGRPALGVHVLQIEINRALYMDERRIEPRGGIEPLKRHMRALMAALTETALQFAANGAGGVRDAAE
ncbi:N-formylglutamate amidohydrolase [Nisaea acidiphila]|uniref:N-formylglutamate amidohydrolase n=1 Tax=Nisaea acidiphila TaxID=1862145 RepID=A0A9J7AU03_9PROT|nr:N-formylglutamate amidohydrolase [Nisaea acidiphila]UUX51195.1 N-formylglutamate amidohydrolase [Nisaea acidiphila]